MAYDSIPNGASPGAGVREGKSTDGAAIINLLNTIVGRFMK